MYGVWAWPEKGAGVEAEQERSCGIEGSECRGLEREPSVGGRGSSILESCPKID